MIHRSIFFLYTLMEKEDQSLCVTVAEVLALLLHINRLHEFTEENSCTSVDSLKIQLSEKFKKLSKESNNGTNTSIKNITSEEEFLQDLFLYIEVFFCLCLLNITFLYMHLNDTEYDISL